MKILNVLLVAESGDVISGIILLVFLFVIGILLTRWIFRIDDIVTHLESIDEKLGANQQPANKQDL